MLAKDGMAVFLGCARHDMLHHGIAEQDAVHHSMDALFFVKWLEMLPDISVIKRKWRRHS